MSEEEARISAIELAISIKANAVGSTDLSLLETAEDVLSFINTGKCPGWTREAEEEVEAQTGQEAA